VQTPSVELTGSESAVIETSGGCIGISFFTADAPHTVGNFVELASSGFYDGIKFHRVIPGFVAQGGDPQTRNLTPDRVIEIVRRLDHRMPLPSDPYLGTGGPGWNQKAEFNHHPHEAGTLAMARSRDVDSASSHFYICLESQPTLDGQYTVFGQVTQGMDVVRALGVGDEILSVMVLRQGVRCG